jgi:predicted DNA binding CopG/RHH family protein
MAIKELKKTVKSMSINIERQAEEFISKGGTLAKSTDINIESTDHRLTLRIPDWLMAKVDEKRKQRLGKVSRNFYILEVLEKATKK